MFTNYSLLGKFLSEMYSVETLDTRFKVYEKYVQMLHFDGVVYSFIPKLTLETDLSIPPIFKYSSSYPIDFIEHYSVERLDKYDFTIRSIQENKLIPMDAREYEKRGIITPEEQSIIRISREGYGIMNTLSIPTMNQKSGIAGATIFSTERDELFQKIKEEHFNTLVTMTHAFHDTVLSKTYFIHEFLPKTLIRFTEKERKVLQFVAEGKTMKELPHIGISKRYGEKILRRLRRKFGNVSTHQLIYYASHLNIV